MIEFYQGYTLAVNPNGLNASVDHFYKYLIGHVNMGLQRSPTLSDSSLGAQAFLKTGHRQVSAILRYAMSCENMKLWIMARRDVRPYAVDFFKLNDDGVSITLIGSKILDTKRSI